MNSAKDVSKKTQDVSKKKIASILNHMIRVFVLPEPNTPAKVCTESKNIQYDFNQDTLSHQIKGNLNFEPFGVYIKDKWEKIQNTKSKKYNYIWDVEKKEKDHLIEVQHIVKMLTYMKGHTETSWASLSLGSIVHLGYYLNDQRNLWLIPKAFNQAKAYIPLPFWYGSKPPKEIPKKFSEDLEQLKWEELQCEIAREYLFTFCTEDGRTPFTELLSLAAEMASLPETTMTFLTVKAGKQILTLLKSWPEEIVKVNLDALQKGYNIADESMSGSWTPKQQELNQKRLKGLALFASDVAHEATEMNQTIATQTSPKLSDDLTIPPLLIQTKPRSSKVQTIATQTSPQSPNLPDYVSDNYVSGDESG